MLTLPVALDLSSRFFTLILGKDSKYSVFLKEWDYFKTLLTQSPANMGSICDYLAVIQLQQDGIDIRPKTTKKEKTRSATRKKQKLDRLQSYAIPPEFTTHLPSLASTHSDSSEDESVALQCTKQFLSESEQDLPSLQVPSLNSYSEFSVTHLKSDDSIKTQKDVGAFEETRKPYNVALLKSKAYSMTRALTTNSHGFIENWQNKQDKQKGDLRTPLRGMVLYENPGKDMPHQFLDQPRISYKVHQDPFSDDSSNLFTHLKKVATTETSQDSSSSDLKYVRSREKTKSNMEEALEELAMKFLLNAKQAALQTNNNLDLI